MLCDNCKQTEATVMYKENINGKKQELHLCSKCSKELGIDKINLNMPISFSDFFGDMLGDFRNNELIPFFRNSTNMKCEQCNSSIEDIINKGKFGCANCYNTFEQEIDSIIKKIQGSNLHIGRLANISDNKVEQSNISNNENKDENKQIENKELSNIDKLKQDLKQAIKEERYEDAAQIRDEIQKNDK